MFGVGVIPPGNLSAPENRQTFSDNFTHEILAQLSVVSKQSVLKKYKLVLFDNPITVFPMFGKIFSKKAAGTRLEMITDVTSFCGRIRFFLF